MTNDRQQREKAHTSLKYVVLKYSCFFSQDISFYFKIYTNLYS